MINKRAEKTFLAVKKELYNSKTVLAYNLAWKKPWSFYGKNGKKEAIRILKEEAKKIIGGGNE